MVEMVRIKHLENPNITTFVNNKQITIRNHEAEVSLEDAKAMMTGPFGYELIGVYDDFIEYIKKIQLQIRTLKTQSAPFTNVLVGTPLAGHKLYSWKSYTDALLALDGKEKLHLCFTIDDPSASWKDQVYEWSKKNLKNFFNITIIEWDSDFNKAWNRVFKITVGRQIIFNFARSHSDISHVWFIDSDNIVPSFALTRLLTHSREATAGLYRFKSVMGGGPVVFNEEGDRTFPPSGLGKQNPAAAPDTGLIECDWTGAGCLLLSRKIFEKYDFSWSKWIQRNGEDAWICMMAQKETGEKLLVDTSVNCGHLDELGKIW